MHLFIVFAAAIGAVATAPPAADEPFPFAPSIGNQYDQAYNKLTNHDLPGAQDLLDNVTRAAPQNPRGWNLLGGLYLQQNRMSEADAAFTRALTLGIDTKRKARTLSGRATVRWQLERLDEAFDDAQAALRLDPDDAMGLLVSGAIQLRRGQLVTARAQLEQLVHKAPEFAPGHLALATALAALGDLDSAAKEAHRAKALGTSTDLAGKIDDAIRERDRRQLWWQAPMASAVFLGLSLLVFFGAGSILSRFEIARLSSVDARLFKNEQRPGEWLVERLYVLVLWFGTVLFYLSVPMMVVLTLAVGCGLLWLLAQLPRIPVQAICIAMLAAVGGAWAIIRGLFLSSGPEPEGRRVTEAEAPQLFAALREVAQVAGARMVDRVQLEPDAGIGVREAGGTMRVLVGQGERVLHLGYAALRGLSVSELKAILAHEYGHFSHGETRLNPVIGRIVGTLLSIITRMNQLGWSAAVNPVYWYLRLYVKVYLAVTAGQSRRRELLADRAAALAYGGDTFARALRRVVENDELFRRGSVTITVGLRESGRTCRDLYRDLDAATERSPDTLRTRRVDEIWTRPSSKFDSHPPSADRAQRVAGISAGRPAETTDARSLFPDADRFAREMTAVIVGRVDAFLARRGLTVEPERELDADDEAQVAAALSMHAEALELASRDGEAGDSLVDPALDELEKIVGAEDRSMVSALTRTSQLKSKRGDTPGAMKALERALHIVESQPKPDEDQAHELREMLHRIRPPALTPDADGP